MKIYQINISNSAYNNTLEHRTAIKDNGIQGGRFLGQYGHGNLRGTEIIILQVCCVR